MNATAKLSSYRQAPRKVRLVANLIKGQPVARAIVELEHRAKRAAPVFVKLLQSAVANAKVAGLDVSALRVVEIRVDKGPVMKRSRPRAQGRAFPIHKHTSHIMVTVTDEPKKGAKKVSTDEKAKEKTAPKKTAAKVKKPAAKK